VPHIAIMYPFLLSLFAFSHFHAKSEFNAYFYVRLGNLYDTDTAT
jgi:hypothetical protein